jgi:hypothetical protein
MKMVTITLPQHVDEALQKFLDHEVVRVEDAPPGRYDEEHLKEVKRLRHAFEGGFREPLIVISAAQNARPEVSYPDNARQILVDWSEIQASGSITLVEKLIEDLKGLPGLDDSKGLQDVLGDLQEKLIELKQRESS